MNVDEPNAIAMPNSNYFPNRYGHTPSYVILHGTASGTEAEAIARYFQSTQGGDNPVSTHYVVGRDGKVIQTVNEANGAYGNGPVTRGHDPWWSPDLNPNLITISIEHVKPSPDNSDLITDAQKAASFQLVKHICERHNIPKRKADAQGGITGHFSMDPVERRDCPGPYPWDELFAYLAEDDTTNNINQLKAAGWKYDTQTATWTAPNGFLVQHGFAEEVSKAWNPQDYPLENEQACAPIELSNPALGGGTRQRFRLTTLEWTPTRGVFHGWTGQELIELERRLQAASTAATLSNAQQNTPLNTQNTASTTPKAPAS